MVEPEDPHPLEVLYAEAESRMMCVAITDATTAAELTLNSTKAYVDIMSRYPELEPAALELMAKLSRRVVQDARLVEATISKDPATPGLERAYICVMSELTKMATALVSTATPRGDQIPDPSNFYADDYRAVVSASRALISASGLAEMTWGMIRSSLLESRRRPPPTTHARPLDDREYYDLKGYTTAADS